MNGFSKWSERDVLLYNARSKKEHQIPTVRDPSPAIERESDLHEDILKECERRGWIALHGSMAHRTRRSLGEWDFVVIADRGRVFLIEVKTRSGKLTEDQQAIQHWARKLGHCPYVVRSFEEFLEVIKPSTMPCHEPMPSAPEGAAGAAATD